MLSWALPVPLLAQQASKRLKIVVAGGHPGDPECGCAGTAARFVALGHEVVFLYLNRGDAYCGSAPGDRCASIRTAEATKACEILGARPVFADQHDGQAIVDGEHYETFGRILRAESPDAVFTHWPVDQHRDHRAISLLALDAWWKQKKSFALFFYEVADDTGAFLPTEYVDISGVEAKRRAACFVHASQSPEKWYPKQVEITRQRGKAKGYSQAEAFLREPGGKPVALP